MMLKSLALASIALTLLAPALPLAAGDAPLYQADFSKAEVDKLPDEILVLDGAFAVKEEGGNKFIELPGAPVDTYGLLYGPSEAAGLEAKARILGTNKGRRYPVFGIGLNGAGGYKLMLAPAKKKLELFKGDEMLVSKDTTWESGAWTFFRLQLRKTADAEWTVLGKAWKEGAPEPAAWTIEHKETTEPSAGRPALWGSPLSGTPIRYDDLSVTRVK